MKTFNVSFPKQLADEIDRIAKEQFGSRSDFLRMAAIKYLREEQRWKGLVQYGRQIGEKIGYQSEEAVAERFTARRRQQESWRSKR